MSTLTRSDINDLLVEVKARDRVCVKANDDGRCAQTHDPHHILKQQILRRHLKGEELERALRDPRNLVYICRLHHQRVEAGMLRIEEATLVQIGFYDFLDEFDLRFIWEGIVAKQLPTHRRLEI